MSERIETDALGEKAVPEDVLWGIHTARALENFNISGSRMSGRLIRALAFVKKACCMANHELGYLEAETASFLLRACDEIIDGQHINEFPLDAIQGGAGTSANMNMNEVLANLALLKAGHNAGDYHFINPIGHVNLHQSTNDVYPTALKVASIYGIRELSSKIESLQGAIQVKENEFAGIVTIGRTEMQDAVPMTLGAIFSGFSEAVARDRWRTFKCEERLRTVNIGGTAVGTGLTAPRNYIFLVIEKLRQLTGLGLARAEQVVGETANADVFVEVSGIISAHAVNIGKLARDLRLLHFTGDIKLPPVQAGSSIMPGKINPVIMEAAISVSMKVLANDKLISEAASQGSLQINEFLPLIAHSLMENIEILININKILTSHISGVTADAESCMEHFDANESIVTAFLPYIGYEKSEKLLSDFRKGTERNLRKYLVSVFGSELVEKTLSPQSLMSLGYRKL